MNDRVLQPREGQAGEFAPMGVIALEELGPTFIKFGQILSVRSEVFSDELVSELAKLQDAATTFPAEAARRIIEEETGQSMPVQKRPGATVSGLIAIAEAIRHTSKAALSMSGSSLIVAINALMLKRTKLAGIRQSGKTAAPGTPNRPATPERAKASAVPANPQPDKKTAA